LEVGHLTVLTRTPGVLDCIHRSSRRSGVRPAAGVATASAAAEVTPAPTPVAAAVAGAAMMDKERRIGAVFKGPSRTVGRTTANNVGNTLRIKLEYAKQVRVCDVWSKLRGDAPPVVRNVAQKRRRFIHGGFMCWRVWGDALTRRASSRSLLAAPCGSETQCLALCSTFATAVLLKCSSCSAFRVVVSTFRTHAPLLRLRF